MKEMTEYQILMKLKERLEDIGINSSRIDFCLDNHWVLRFYDYDVYACEKTGNYCLYGVDEKYEPCDLDFILGMFIIPHKMMKRVDDKLFDVGIKSEYKWDDEEFTQIVVVGDLYVKSEVDGKNTDGFIICDWNGKIEEFKKMSEVVEFFKKKEYEK